MGKKNSKVSPILLIAGAFAAWYLFSRANTIGSLNFVPIGMSVTGGGVSVAIQVQNPTNNNLLLSSFSGNLAIGGSNVGNVSDFTPTTIAANSASQINLLILPNAFAIAADVINNVTGNEGSGSIQAQLTGTANVNGVPVPVNLPFS
jgi:hypothetical protein